MAKEPLSSKLAVILHADVADSTRLVQQDERLAHERIQDTFNRFGNYIEKYCGRVLEMRGDALLAEFDLPSDAVASTLAFQASHSTFLSSLDDDLKPGIRVGVAMGEVVIADNTVTGAGVVLAQRVEQLADTGGLCITAAIQESLPKRLSLEFESLGEKTLKGFDDAIRVFKVRLNTGESVPAPRTALHTAKPQFLSTQIGVMVIVILAIMVGIVYTINTDNQRIKPASTERESSPLPDNPSIAVLPFTNMSNDPEQEYFADGLTEDLLTDLSKISALTVISRTSTFAYKGKSPDIRDVARNLGVSHIIEGSVRKVGGRIRITAQLIDATSGKHLWAERYDRKFEDIFTLQDEVRGKIITALAIKLAPEDEARIAIKKTNSVEAYDLVMRGRYHASSFTREGNTEAIHSYESAIRIDPEYAIAYARMANMYNLRSLFGWSDDAEGDLTRALELAEKASALDDKNPFIHWTQGRIYSRLRSGGIKNLFKAVDSLERTIELDPNYADAHAFISHLYIGIGKPDEALKAIEKALKLNPHYPFWYIRNRGIIMYMKRDYPAAIADLEVAVDKNPTAFIPHWWLAASYAQADMQDDAEWQIEELSGLGFESTVKEVLETSVIFHAPFVEHYAAGLRKAGLPE